jgi:DNA-binding LytR/AlgR family response regulator
MLRIAVCDDNEHVCAHVKELCASFLGGLMKHEMLMFYDGLQLIDYRKSIDILFLDIEMPFLDGFEAAEELNKKSRDMRIIFLTNHPEMMQKAFKVKAFRYLIKPVNKKDIQENLVDAISDISSNKKVIVDSSEADHKRDVIVFVRDILYIEAIGDGTVIYTVDQGNLISRKPLKYWAEELSDLAFSQTHKSFIISLAHVASLRKNIVIITSGKEIPLSKRKAAMFRECIAEYIRSLNS